LPAAQGVQQHPVFIQIQKNTAYNAQFDKELTQYPFLNDLEQRTQVPKTYAVIGFLISNSPALLSTAPSAS